MLSMIVEYLSQVEEDGVCFPSSFPPFLLPVFDYYSQHFTAALELCRVSYHGNNYMYTHTI